MATNPPAPPPQRPYTNAFLLDYSHEHVFYEFDMLSWAAYVLTHPTRVEATSEVAMRRLNNALVEAFPVHLRNVIEALIDAHDRADKEVGHLTSMRLPPNDPRKRWDPVPIMRDLLPKMRLFVHTAEPAKLATRVRALVDAQP